MCRVQRRMDSMHKAIVRPVAVRRGMCEEGGMKARERARMVCARRVGARISLVKCAISWMSRFEAMEERIVWMAMVLGDVERKCDRLPAKDSLPTDS